MSDRRFTKSLELKGRMHRAIPGGCHTYAKGDDQYPEFIPPLIVKGRGYRVWDADDNESIEYGMGLRAVSLGHAYPSINAAVRRELELGSNYGRPAVIALETAETFLDMVPGADMVKFAKNGSDVVSAAIKLARAYTGRDTFAVCADHPFFSVDDWFIATTPVNRGIPVADIRLALGFRYNDIESVRALFSEHEGAMTVNCRQLLRYRQDWVLL
ncbi:MAG: glutamate-1-semialdehyde 2,1-aminomutase [Halioglobus sp.]|jgi:glutamate-1-semialdehyde 2,1-aminomutase